MGGNPSLKDATIYYIHYNTIIITIGRLMEFTYLQCKLLTIYIFACPKITMNIIFSRARDRKQFCRSDDYILIHIKLHATHREFYAHKLAS